MGQLLINFDQCEVETAEAENSGKLDQEIESAAKQWKHLYDPDFNLLFNPYLFPVELLQGYKVGDYMIIKYGLFDNELQPDNIVLSSRSRDNPEDSGEGGPTICLA